MVDFELLLTAARPLSPTGRVLMELQYLCTAIGALWLYLRLVNVLVWCGRWYKNRFR